MIVRFHHWRFDYNPESGIALVERRPAPGNVSMIDGRSDAGWTLSDIEQFPTGLSADEFLDVLDDLAPGRFLS